MNETIGVKGGHNDYKRVMTITRKQKEKLKKYQEEQELKELKKAVQKKQVYTLIKTLPIVLVGQAFKELTKPNKKDKDKEKFIVVENEEVKEKPETKRIVIVLKDGTKQVIEVPIKIELKEEVYKEPSKEEKPKEKETKEQVKEIKQEELKQEVIKQEVEKKPESKEENKEAYEFSDLTENQQRRLQKLQARKIIDVYEKQLKDIRYELRNLIIDYNTLVSEEEKIIKAEEEEKLLDKLNEIIKKLEELKDKIRIEDLDKYDDNYIYTLIEGYLEDFKDKKLIKAIKDSPLYIAISEKLDEFDKKKESFKDKVEDRKEELEDKEDRFSELKEKYYKLDKINRDLEEFYREQELILKEMREKVDKAVSVTERVEVQVESMNKRTQSLLRRLSILMLIPGARGAKATAAMFAIYKEIARNILFPKTTTKKYTEITVTDYSRDIEKSIKKLDEVASDLYKASKDVDKMISSIKEEFSEYIGVLPECDELLRNLDKVKSNLKEKEYELEKIRIKEEKELERNNTKQLTKV